MYIYIYIYRKCYASLILYEYAIFKKCIKFLYLYWLIILCVISVAARSKAWVCGRSLAGMVGSNPA
jgi:hypothetical protein